MKWMSVMLLVLCFSAAGFSQDFIIDPIVAEGADEAAPAFSQQVAFVVQAGDGKVKMEWNADGAFLNRRFFVERSLDGEVFTIISEFPGRETVQARRNFQFTDGMVVNGTEYYYRLASLGSDRQVTFHSEIARVRPLSGITEAHR